MSMLSSHMLSAAHLKGIGTVAAEWTYVEIMLEALIWQVAGIDNERGYCVTTHITSETRINILESLADKRLVTPGLKNELKDRIADLRRLRTERNNIVHSIWMNPKAGMLPEELSPRKRGRKPTPQSVKVTAKGTVKIINTPYSSRKIMSTAEEISTLHGTMYSLLTKMQSDERAREAFAKVVREHQKPAPDPDPKTTKLP